MTLKSLLEDFGGEKPPSRTASSGKPLPDGQKLESIRKAAFEDGYASGWEDAQNTANAARKHVDAEFQRCIQDMGFTYHEAVENVRSEMKMLVDALFESFLPSILQDVFRETIREEILRESEKHLAPSIELQVHPDTVDLFNELLTDHQHLSISIIEEPTLGPNQAFVSFSDREIMVDLDHLIDVARSHLDAIASEKPKEVVNG